MKAIYLKRLRTLVQILKDAKGKPGFDMSYVTSPSSFNHAPACVIGHFAARTDKQRVVFIDRFGAVRRASDSYYMWWDTIRDYFGLNHTEMRQLFGGNGCGDAKTRPQAIKFIEKFITNKESEK